MGYLLGSMVGSASTVATELRRPDSPEKQRQARRRRRIFWSVVLFSILTILVVFFVWAAVYIGLAARGR
jgi:cell division septal protein FtsQ